MQRSTKANARGTLRSRHRLKLFAAKRRRPIGRRRREQAAKYVYKGRQFAALTSAEREARDEALEVVSIMRREGISFTRAARQVGVVPSRVWRYAGVALRRKRNGQIIATPADRLLRRMRVLTSDGMQTIDLRGSQPASIVARHWSAVRRFLETGDESRLQAFTDMFPGGKRLMIDPVAIDRETGRGELDFEDIYDLTV